MRKFFSLSVYDGMIYIKTRGIVLTRTDYGEADKIIIFLTPDQGKVRTIAKAVRKSASKLAGGVELFSISEISTVKGRGELNILTSARLEKHFGNIVKNIERTQLAYEFLSIINRATEDEPEPAYFDLLSQSLMALDDPEIDLSVTSLWFKMQLLKLAGHMPNLKTDSTGVKLSADKKYHVDFEKMLFEPNEEGSFNANQIKFLRLGFSAKRPNVLNRVNSVLELASATEPIVQTMLKSHVRIN